MTADIAPTKDELRMAEMMAERELSAMLREAVECSGLDRQEIARRLGVHKSGVTKVLNSERNLTVRMAGRLLRAAGARIGFSWMPVSTGQTHADGLKAHGIAMLQSPKVQTATAMSANRAKVVEGLPTPLSQELMAL